MIQNRNQIIIIIINGKILIINREKIGKPGRFHPEAECKTKLNSNYKFAPNKSGNAEKNIKIINNTELEELLNKEIDSKN
jgi:hypothetical protein